MFGFHRIALASYGDGFDLVTLDQEHIQAGEVTMRSQCLVFQMSQAMFRGQMAFFLSPSSRQLEPSSPAVGKDVLRIPVPEPNSLECNLWVFRMTPQPACASGDGLKPQAATSSWPVHTPTATDLGNCDFPP